MLLLCTLKPIRMKKVFLDLLAIALFAGFPSCSEDDEAPVLGAYVAVTVVNVIGTPQPGMDVYMFENVEPDETTDISTASKKVTTDSNGVAGFKLNLTELNITESQTHLYFAVYYKVGDTFLLKAGDGYITVKRNDEKSVTITILI